jgi:hypothetical protein
MNIAGTTSIYQYITEAYIGTGMKQAAGLGYMEDIGGWPCSESALSRCFYGHAE